MARLIIVTAPTGVGRTKYSLVLPKNGGSAIAAHRAGVGVAVPAKPITHPAHWPTSQCASPPPASQSSEQVNESHAYFGFKIATCNRAILNIAAKIFIEYLAENLPVLIDRVAIGVIEPDRAES